MCREVSNLLKLQIEKETLPENWKKREDFARKFVVFKVLDIGSNQSTHFRDFLFFSKKERKERKVF